MLKSLIQYIFDPKKFDVPLTNFSKFRKLKKFKNFLLCCLLHEPLMVYAFIFH